MHPLPCILCGNTFLFPHLFPANKEYIIRQRFLIRKATIQTASSNFFFEDRIRGKSGEKEIIGKKTLRRRRIWLPKTEKAPLLHPSCAQKSGNLTNSIFVLTTILSWNAPEFPL